jgi:tetratricopeptide (TPR) repeat protein
MRIDLVSSWLRVAPLWLIAALPLSLAAVTQPTPVREADATCSRCHNEIYRNYLLTPMANASGLAAEKLIPGEYEERAVGLDYKIASLHGQAVLTTRRIAEQSNETQRPLSYFLGSGHLGITYLYSIDNFLFESPIAWYAASHDFDMKPGLAESKKMSPSIPMQSSCMRCHMSAVQPSDAGTINRYTGLAFLHSGITCEACHGDTAKHVAAGKKIGVVNPSRLNADQRDSICISCHLEGDVTVERKGHSALNYRPGESIATYLSFFVYGGANPTARGVSEVEQFAKSQCKQASGDTMSCTSCHDPHFTPDAQHRTGFYRSKCLACHNQPQFAETHHAEQQDCISCHMPRNGAENIPHVAWTDHRILRLPESAKPAARSEEIGDLAPIFSPGSTRRDLAMAHYKALLEGNPSLETKAWSLLEQQQNTIAGDLEALDAFGVMSAERGDSKAAEGAFQKILELDRYDLTALSNLGTLEAREGQFKEAITTLQTAFERNEDISGLAMNLARVQCMAGDETGARNTLQTTLIYNPDLAEVHALLKRLSDCDGANGKR